MCARLAGASFVGTNSLVRADWMPYRRSPMSERSPHGWRALTHGFPWFDGAGRFPLPAYSEFMPPPRLGMSPYGGVDPALFAENDPCGWRVQEVDEVHQIQPGLQDVADQVMRHLLKFMADPSSVYVAG